MHKQTLRVVLYSSLAIFIMAFVWGMRQIPATNRIGDEALRISLDQELIVLNGAVKASTQALKYRLLDVLKAEGTDRTSRTFIDSPFVAATLLEWDSVQWKSLWYSGKQNVELRSDDVKEAIKGWPLSTISTDEVYYVKVADLQGQALFAIVVPVRKPNQIPMLGIGIFAATQFGLNFAADQNRDIRVYDTHGFALALSHPAYLGSSLKREDFVKQMLEGEEVSLRHEWVNDKGTSFIGLASRVSGTNLIATIETPSKVAGSWAVQGWTYLILCALGACALNWYLFTSLLNPLLNQLTQTEELTEKMRRQMKSNLEPKPKGVLIRPELANAKLIDLDFVDDGEFEFPVATATPIDAQKGIVEPSAETTDQANEVGPTPLSRLVQSALRSFEGRIRDSKINVTKLGLENIQVHADPLQLQTALEEVLKNSIEAMADSKLKNLTLSASELDGRIRLVIEDSGCGIADSDINKAFDPFYSTKDTEGVARGLGLNVVRRVIEELEGSVKLVSRQGEGGSGTQVTLEWPGVGTSEIHLPNEINEIDQLALLAGEYAVEKELNSIEKNWPEFEIRKPRVRSLD